MTKLAVSMPTSLGEIINYKFHLDMIKSRYDEIKLSFNKSLWGHCLHTEAPDWSHKESLWNKLLSDLGHLFFSEAPYILTEESYPFHDAGSFVHAYGIRPTKAEMGHLLCKGKSLDIGEEYIVITTKARQMNQSFFHRSSPQLWDVLRKLSAKYRIVILGERVVEMRKEYDVHGSSIFGIYNQIIANLPKERILDLSVPALGETVSDIKDLQQDCLIMKEAKCVITIGVGGPFCLSTSVASMAIGFRTDDLGFTNQIFDGREYPNAIVTKNWGYFISVLERYL